MGEAALQGAASTMRQSFVAAAQIGDEGHCEQDHPELPDNLPKQELERTKGKPQKYDRVDYQADAARSNNRNY